MSLWLNRLAQRLNLANIETVEDPHDIDRAKLVLMTTQFSKLGVIFILIFATVAIFSSRFVLGFVLYCGAILLGLNIVFLRRTGKYRVSAYVGVILFGILCQYLLCTGGASNTGPLWVYIFPPLCFFLLGFRHGFYTIFTMLIMVFCGLFIVDLASSTTRYPFDFKVRFLVSFFVVTIFSLVNEFSRERIQIQLVRLTQKLDATARTDELTGLANRRDMHERLKFEKARAERTGRPFAIVLCDIDYFKKVNDTYGHDCGDHVLVEVSGIIKTNIREQDFVCRWGGEEFLIVLIETPGIKDAHLVAERIRNAIASKKIVCKNDHLKITMSFGIKLSTGQQDIEECIKDSDICLYKAKELGRNIVIS